MIEGIEHGRQLRAQPAQVAAHQFRLLGAFRARPGDQLVRTLSILPHYLAVARDRQVIDYRDWGVPLGRRFRALKLWFVIRATASSACRRCCASTSPGPRSWPR